MRNSANHGALAGICALAAVLVALWFWGDGDPPEGTRRSSILGAVPGATDGSLRERAPMPPRSGSGAPVPGGAPSPPESARPERDAPERSSVPSAGPLAGSIAGRVLRQADGEPVSHFVVRLRGGASPVAWKEAEVHRVASESGEFHLGARPRGSYALRIEAADLEPLVVQDVVVPGAEALRLELRRGTTVLGVVTDAFGRPARDVTLELHPVPRGRGAGAVRRERTDASGAYAFSQLEPGRWEVLVPDPHGRPEPLQRSPVLPMDRDQVQVWSVRLDPATDVILRVQSAGEPAPAGTRASLMNREGVSMQVGVGGGTARFERIPPGEYDLVIRYPGGSVALEERLPVPAQATPVVWAGDLPPPAPPSRDF